MSIGGLGGEGPKNVVYRTPLGNTVNWSETGGGLDPYHLHTLRQWQGAYWDGLPDPEPTPTPETAKLPQDRLDQLKQPFDLDISDVSPEEAQFDFDNIGSEFDFGTDEEFIQDLRDRYGNF